MLFDLRKIFISNLSHIWKLQRSSLRGIQFSGSGIFWLYDQILAYCLSHKSVIVEGDSKGIWSVHGPRLLEHAADSVTQIHCPEVTTVLPCPDNWFQHYTFYSIWTHLKIWIKVLLAIWGFFNNGMQLKVYKNSNIHYLSLHFKMYRLYLTSVTEIWQSFLTPV